MALRRQQLRDRLANIGLANIWGYWGRSFPIFPKRSNERLFGSYRPMSALAAVEDLEFVARIGREEAGYMAETLG
jgi:hypothetical protein